MNIKTVDISEIKPYEKNAKLHSDEQVTRIANSIENFGFVQPLVLDENNVIVIGHGRYAAAQKLGYSKVPCLYADDLTSEQIKALRLADNQVAKSKTDNSILAEELNSILEIDMEQFGFDLDISLDLDIDNDTLPRLQHNVFENQERMQFESNNYYGIPDIQPTQTVGDKMIRFCDWRDCDNPEEYIAHFFYDDYKFMAAWREPDKYVERLRKFKAVVTPAFSMYTDFPRALQILSCYRRQWVGAYWQSLGLDVIPCVLWADKESFKYAFAGVPKGATVAVETIGVGNDAEWNGKTGTMFKDGFDTMMKELKPKTVLYYGDMMDGLEGNIIRIPSFYEERRKMLNERVKK